MASYAIFTINAGQITEGTLVGKLTLKGAGKDIPAILIGEEGRGRARGVLPVGLTPDQYKEWEAKGTVRIRFAEVGQTQSGKPKLFAKAAATADDKVICVMPTHIGYRGGNAHTGDKSFEPCSRRGQLVTAEYTCRTCGVKLLEEGIGTDAFYKGATHPDEGQMPRFHPFPGEILAKGVIAQGGAGAMGSGDQYVAVLPKGTWFRTSYSGRLYGAPAAHYYLWDGQRLMVVTWEERQLLDDY